MCPYRKAGQRDQVVNVGSAMALAAGRRNAGIAGICRAGKQPIEGGKNAVLVSGNMLTIDLLQTQDVGL